MCAQCAMGAATAAAAGTTGMRAWLATRNYAWLTRKRLKLITGVLIAGGLFFASVSLG